MLAGTLLCAGCTIPHGSTRNIASPNTPLQLTPALIIGNPKSKKNAGSDHEFDRAVWMTPETLLHIEPNGRITRRSLPDGNVQWAQQLSEPFYRAHAGDNHILLELKQSLAVLDSNTGSPISWIKPEHIMPATDSLPRFTIRTGIWLPSLNTVLVHGVSRENTRHSFLMDPKTFTLSREFTGDDIQSDKLDGIDNQQRFRLYRRHNIPVWPFDGSASLNPALSHAMDAPFVSNVFYDGNRTLIYSVDNSWSTGTIHVCDTLKKQELANFDAGNGHIEMDVDFERSRIAVSGTSRNLTISSFTGDTLAHTTNAALQRILDVNFAPDGTHVSVSGWENAVRVYRLDESP